MRPSLESAASVVPGSVLPFARNTLGSPGFPFEQPFHGNRLLSKSLDEVASLKCDVTHCLKHSTHAIVEFIRKISVINRPLYDARSTRMRWVLLRAKFGLSDPLRMPLIQNFSSFAGRRVKLRVSMFTCWRSV